LALGAACAPGAPQPWHSGAATLTVRGHPPQAITSNSSLCFFNSSTVQVLAYQTLLFQVPEMKRARMHLSNRILLKRNPNSNVLVEWLKNVIMKAFLIENGNGYLFFSLGFLAPSIQSDPQTVLC